MKYLGFYTGIDQFHEGSYGTPAIRTNSFVYYETTDRSDILGYFRIFELTKNSADEYWYVKKDEVIAVGSQLKNGCKIFLRTPYAFEGKECVVEEMEIKTSLNGHIERPLYLKLREMYTSKHMAFYDHPRILDILENSCGIRFDMKVKTRFTFANLTTPDTVGDMIKDELKKSIEQEVMKDVLYGTGGFTTNPDPFKVVKIAEKETETMEKKMTVTDSFLKNLKDITITSTYSKLDHGFGDPYYIYYPETEITEDIADTLLTVLIMAKKDFMHKVVFNPKKGTTTLYKSFVGDPVTVRCNGAEFDYILGYEMAGLKAYLGKDDYNWFNKIKNHRKTHIEYTEKPTEPKVKKPSKKGGKKS